MPFSCVISYVSCVNLPDSISRNTNLSSENTGLHVWLWCLTRLIENYGQITGIVISLAVVTRLHIFTIYSEIPLDPSSFHFVCMQEYKNLTNTNESQSFTNLSLQSIHLIIGITVFCKPCSHWCIICFEWTQIIILLLWKWISKWSIYVIFVFVDIISTFKGRCKSFIWHWRRQILTQKLSKLFLQYGCHQLGGCWIDSQVWLFSDNLFPKKGEWKLINTAVMALCERSWELVIFYAN